MELNVLSKQIGLLWILILLEIEINILPSFPMHLWIHGQGGSLIWLIEHWIYMLNFSSLSTEDVKVGANRTFFFFKINIKQNKILQEYFETLDL